MLKLCGAYPMYRNDTLINTPLLHFDYTTCLLCQWLRIWPCASSEHMYLTLSRIDSRTWTSQLARGANDSDQTCALPLKIGMLCVWGEEGICVFVCINPVRTHDDASATPPKTCVVDCVLEKTYPHINRRANTFCCGLSFSNTCECAKSIHKNDTLAWCERRLRLPFLSNFYRLCYLQCLCIII